MTAVMDSTFQEYLSRPAVTSVPGSSPPMSVSSPALHCPQTLSVLVVERLVPQEFVHTASFTSFHSDEHTYHINQARPMFDGALLPMLILSRAGAVGEQSYLVLNQRVDRLQSDGQLADQRDDALLVGLQCV
jgi:hypothetical protein